LDQSMDAAFLDNYRFLALLGCGAMTAVATFWSPSPAKAMAKVPVFVCSPVTEEAIAAASAGMSVTAVAAVGPNVAVQPEPQARPKPRPPAHCLWAALSARRRSNP
jgi:hypothetical protein